jgi:hypothetical protein
MSGIRCASRPLRGLGRCGAKARDRGSRCRASMAQRPFYFVLALSTYFRAVRGSSPVRLATSA